MVAAYALVLGLVPLPALKAELAPEFRTATEYLGSDAAVVAAVDGTETVAGAAWIHNGEIAPHGQWANSVSEVPIASITKVVTVLATLEASPGRADVESGGPGRRYTVTERDIEILDDVLAQNGIHEDAPVGTELTERQLIELTLLPSANNFAIAYAEWVFGSNAEFVAAARQWLDRHGLTHTKIVEPSGLDKHNVSTVPELLRLAAIAMQNPAVAEVAAMQRADIPGIGEIENTNALLKSGDAIGLKTGALDANTFNLLAVETYGRGSREFTIAAAVLGSKDRPSRNALTRELLAAMKTASAAVEVLPARSSVGAVHTWDGARVPLVTDNDEPVNRVLLPGEKATVTATVSPLRAAASGERVGEVAVVSPTGRGVVAVRAAAEITDPGFWWRVTNPGKVLNW